MADEEWLPVVGYEAQYEVSDLGRVRRCGQAHRAGNGRGGGATIGRMLTLKAIRNGYVRAQLWIGGRPVPKLVHVLVAAAFIGPCPEGQEVNHKDGDKTNNRPSNLEYLTHAQNNLHAWRTGLRGPAKVPVGEAHHSAKLTSDQVAQIRARYRRGVYGAPRLAREFGVNQTTIQRIVAGKLWKEAPAA